MLSCNRHLEGWHWPYQPFSLLVFTEVFQGPGEEVTACIYFEMVVLISDPSLVHSPDPTNSANTPRSNIN